jgi:hypothetical protein
MIRCHLRRNVRKSTLVFAFGLLIALAISVLTWKLSVVGEPEYEGKKISVWLDELRAVNFARTYDPDLPAAKALRAMGTNALPWLLQEMRGEGDDFRATINYFLNKQTIITARFLDLDTRINRAFLGFEILGRVAAPAIPELLASVERLPLYAPFAIAAMGETAIPALQCCLTNLTEYPSIDGVVVPIPGNTIAGIFNALERRQLMRPQIECLMPGIRAWAESTNSHAAGYAQRFVDFHSPWPSLERPAELDSKQSSFHTGDIGLLEIAQPVEIDETNLFFEWNVLIRSGVNPTD